MTDSISLEQAIKLTNASSETLNQFVKTGLLEITYKDGESIFSRQAINTLFNLTDAPEIPDSNDINLDLPPSESSAQACDDSVEPSSASGDRIQPKNRSDLVANIPLAGRIEKSRISEVGTVVETYDSTSDILTHNDLLKEQIQELKKERDWLRARVEKLEHHAEATQVLLMANSKTVSSALEDLSNRNSQKPRIDIWKRIKGWMTAEAS